MLVFTDWSLSVTNEPFDELMVLLQCYNKDIKEIKEGRIVDPYCVSL